jgi:hypothetical protein
MHSIPTFVENYSKVSIKFYVKEIDSRLVSQLHFEGSVRMKFTLLKLGLGSPSRLPKLQNSIARVKTACIGVFFISLESY